MKRIAILLAIFISGCSVDTWPDPKADDWWGITSASIEWKWKGNDLYMYQDRHWLLVCKGCRP